MTELSVVLWTLSMLFVVVVTVTVDGLLWMLPLLRAISACPAAHASFQADIVGLDISQAIASSWPFHCLPLTSCPFTSHLPLIHSHDWADP